MIFKAIGQLPSLYLAKRKRKEIEKDITNKTLHRVLKHEVITLSVDIKHLSNLFTLQEISWMACQVLFGLQALTVSHANERSLEVTLFDM